MIIRKQNGYDHFHCIADKCPKSCCEGWQIVIDDDSLERYQNHTGLFEERLQRGIDFQEGAFRQSSMRCSMLADSGLCDLQSTLGEAGLCDTCRQYPRHVEEYPDLREYSLSLSCPEAVRVLIDPAFQFTLSETENDQMDDPEEFEDFDLVLFDKLIFSRDKMMAIISDQTLPLEERIDRIIVIARELQELFDLGEIFAMDDVAARYQTSDAAPVSHSNVHGQDMAGLSSYLLQSLDLLLELEVLEESWTDLIRKTKICWNENAASSDFRKQAMYPDPATALIYQKVLQSLFFTYFCGSIYDGQIYARTMIAAVSVRWIMMIHAAHQNLPLDEIIYLFSREVEHSDPNVNALIRFFEKDLDG